MAPFRLSWEQMRADGAQLREQVKEAYSRAADQPENRHPFPVGRKFAENAGYPVGLLASLPSVAVDAFCGASNVSVFAEIPTGATVLDLGCGAGLDTLIAARNVGPAGRVIAVDFSETMLARARQAVHAHGATQVEVRRGDAERIPVEDRTIDVAIVNGIFNLNPARDSIFRELARVVRDGGVVYAAEIVLREAPGPFRWIARTITRSHGDPRNWFA